MAYLKGNTYVDGDLYVEGSLKVKRLLDNSGLNLPYLLDETSSTPGRILRYDSTDGAVDHSHISEEIIGSAITYTFSRDNYDLIRFVNNNLPLEVTNANSIDFKNTPAAKIRVQDPESDVSHCKLIGIIETNAVLSDNTRLPPDYVKGAPTYVDANNKVYVKCPPRPSSRPSNTIWFAPTKFCYAADLTKE